MFRLYSWEMLHSCWFWLNALIIHLKLSDGFWEEGKSAKPAIDYYYCQNVQKLHESQRF